jgi:hypothetical protein
MRASSSAKPTAAIGIAASGVHASSAPAWTYADAVRMNSASRSAAQNEASPSR